VKTLLLDPRISPEEVGNEAVKNARKKGHELIFRTLFRDARVNRIFYQYLILKISELLVPEINLLVLKFAMVLRINYLDTNYYVPQAL